MVATHYTYLLKSVKQLNFMVCNLYLNKTIKNPLLKYKKENKVKEIKGWGSGYTRLLN